MSNPIDNGFLLADGTDFLLLSDGTDFLIQCGGVSIGNVVAGASALPSGVNTKYFYTRFTGYLVPSATGTYTIGLNSADGANLYIGSQPIFTNLGTIQTAQSTLAYSQSGTIALTSGTIYPVVIEWAHGGSAGYELDLIWTPPLGSIEYVPYSCIVDTSFQNEPLNSSWWNGTPAYYFPAGTGLTDPTNATIYGDPPASGSGHNVVSSLTAVTGAIQSARQGGNAIALSTNGIGWVCGQAWSSAGVIDIFVVQNANAGYMFRLDYRSGASHLISVTSNINSSLGTVIATAGNNPSAITGWLNFCIGLTGNGYMSLWVNGTLACSVIDTTYLLPTNSNVEVGIQFGYEVSTGKIGPQALGVGGGSSALNANGFASVGVSTFSYTSTATSITWSWSSFTVYNYDGSSITVASNSQTFTGLTASTTYFFGFYVNVQTGALTVVLSDLGGGKAESSVAQVTQTLNGDGNIGINYNITAFTPASGTSSGSGGGLGFGGSGRVTL